MRLPTERTSRLGVEVLEDRLTPSWWSVPPATITVPTSAVAVTLNNVGDASGTASIANNELDWYKFTAVSGVYAVAAVTPRSNVDTVIGVYDASGHRVASNDDISRYNRDSFLRVALAAGTYYLGVTNFPGGGSGAYNWAINGPNLPPSPPPPPPPTGAFQITLRTSGLTAAQQAVFQQAANRWAQVIIGDLPNANYFGVSVDDVLIDASASAIDGPGGILGQAGPDFFRAGTDLPIHGVMQFDSADLASLQASGGLYYTVLHEMGHVLGFGTIWEDRGLLTGAGTSNPLFTGANAVAAYDAIFHTSATGVPVENQGGQGTADSHWRETVFNNEVMTGYLDGGVNPLSRVTVASMADLGYQVNLNAADAYTPPGHLVAGATTPSATTAAQQVAGLFAHLGGAFGVLLPPDLSPAGGPRRAHPFFDLP
jgi:hypothetical protein